ncbi:hypothetical protein ABH926_004934 [Catenulispora sp. GP43]
MNTVPTADCRLPPDVRVQASAIDGRGMFEVRPGAVATPGTTAGWPAARVRTGRAPYKDTRPVSAHSPQRESLPADSIAARAASSRATGTRNGEQDT